MHLTRKSIAFAVMMAVAAAAAVAQEKEKPKAQKPVPVPAVKAGSAPKVDGSADDAVWKTAPAVKLEAIKGVNFKNNKGNTNGTVQLAYTADTLYMLITYDDPTFSVKHNPYVKKADGKWEMLKDPGDKGNDNNKFNEDKVSVMWNIKDSILGFSDKFSCTSVCHGGEKGKAYGAKYSEEEEEVADMWVMRYAQGGALGYGDDFHVDSTKFSPAKSPDAGRKADPVSGGGFELIKLVNGKPEFMGKDAKPANKGGTYWVKAESKVPFDDAKFKAGDEVASVIVAPFQGDRGDVSVGAKWEKGKWTVEFARKLKTGSKHDIDLSDPGKAYAFGIGFFDGAEVRHAYVQAPLHLQFQK
ncbi:MAG TPA: ethylbenzene dehydrogenase-related protein [Rhodocyclaceae bacterium]|nr:ethylbenzene dehydrogenase-related protein [Rhodocyclaceae bacterium]